MTQPLDVLAMMAHPDDAEIFCGGALIKSAEAGERTGVVDLTAGEGRVAGDAREPGARGGGRGGGDGAGRAAVRGLPDTAVVNDRESQVVVAGLIRELRPRVVVTHWVEGRHPDHRRAARLARDASFLAGLRNFPAGGAPHRPEKVVYALAFREDAVKPTFVIDISAQMDRKLEALAAYGTQFEGKSGIGEVFPGGDRPVLEQIRAVHATYGAMIRCRFGEPYWTEEVVMAEGLGGLGVSSF